MTGPDRSRRPWGARLWEARYIAVAAAFTALFLYGAFDFRNHPYFARGGRAVGWEIPLYETIFLIAALMFGCLLVLAVRDYLNKR